MDRDFAIAQYENSVAFYGRQPDLFIQSKYGDLDQAQQQEIKTKLAEHISTSLFRPKDATGQSLYSRVDGVSDVAREATSLRKDQIVERVDSLREELSKKYPGNYFTESELRAMANLDTREAKTVHSQDRIEHDMREMCAAKGTSLENETRGIREAGLERYEQQQLRREPQPNEYDLIREAAANISEQRSVFSREDLLKAAAILSRGDVSLPQLKEAFQELLKDREIIQAKGYDNIFMTKETIKAERENNQRLHDGRGAVQPIGIAENVDKYLTEKCSHLNDQQKNAVRLVLTTGDRYVAINGVSGAGKSTLVDAIRGYVEQKGIEIYGTSHMATAARQLEAKGRVPSQTLDSLVYRDSGKPGLGIVDEMTMLSTVQMRDFLRTVDAQPQGRAVFIGDVHQLSGPSAGRPVAYAIEHNQIETAKIDISHRQQTPHTQEIAGHLNRGDVERAFQSIEKHRGEHDTLRIVSADRQEAYQQVAAAYMEKAKLGEAAVYTPRHIDREGINNAIREARKAAGEIGQGETIEVRQPNDLMGVQRNWAGNYSQGDRGFFRDNWKGFRAGEAVDIRAIDIQNNTISVARRDGTLQSIDMRAAGRHFSSYAVRDMEVSAGDKIVALKNDTGKKGVGLTNKETGVVVKIDSETLIMKTDSGEIKTIPLDQYNYFTHGYCQTVHGGQGADIKTSIAYVPTGYGDLAQKLSKDNSTMKEAFLVAGTRMTHDYTLMTDNVQHLEALVQRETFKEMALDYLGKKLPDKGRPGMETLNREVAVISKTMQGNQGMTMANIQANLIGQMPEERIIRALAILESRGEVVRGENKTYSWNRISEDQQRLENVRHAIAELREDGKRHFTIPQLQTELKVMDENLSLPQIRQALNKFSANQEITSKERDDGKTFYRIEEKASEPSHEIAASKGVEIQNTKQETIASITREYALEGKNFTAKDIAGSDAELGVRTTESDARQTLEQGVETGKLQKETVNVDGKEITFFRDTQSVINEINNAETQLLTVQKLENEQGQEQRLSDLIAERIEDLKAGNFTEAKALNLEIENGINQLSPEEKAEIIKSPEVNKSDVESHIEHKTTVEKEAAYELDKETEHGGYEREMQISME
jgi:Fe2+ or Zn2+ uptake regulation protein